SSLLDEGTAAAEAMWMMYETANKKRKKNPAKILFADKNIFPQTKEVLETRAGAKGIEIEYNDFKEFVADEKYFGIIVQYPDSTGAVNDYRELIDKSGDIPVTFIADLLSLTLLTPPGEIGADIAVGTTQRFGIPMDFGGPHAAYMSAKEDFKRKMPGRIIGVSVDATGKPAYRMALQTREQHIKREKATSNICTAQALLATMAGFYAIYHGKEGLKNIAIEINSKASLLKNALSKMGLKPVNNTFFDTLTYELDIKNIERLKEELLKKKINLFYSDNRVGISVDEITDINDLNNILEEFGNVLNVNPERIEGDEKLKMDIPETLKRESDYLSHEIFNKYRSETELMRYMKFLENKDVSLVHSMISLGSCTMKLNAATEMMPVTWQKFTDMHPFAPKDQVEGYLQMIKELSDYLQEITGFEACTFQPNSGAQGEFTGLMTIRAYHRDRGDNQRTVTLVPSSAHGTNPASAVMAGMDVVIVKCDENGNIDVTDLKEKAEQHADRLSAFMVTYPSTHGVFEREIVEMCKIIHDNGGLVYMDGANMNAQIGLTKPSIIGADICHLNLHKTFAIPHGGGGPGVGPVLANDKLAKYLPGHIYDYEKREKAIKAVSSAPYGSAGILMISHAYIRMMGADGLKNATEIAILNANYIKSVLSKHYDIVYTNQRGMVAHEMILDLRPFKHQGVSAEDVAKRLMDYGFHAPTVSFPVHDTFMIEPTESENKEEMDRFCDAMIRIRKEIKAVVEGEIDSEDNPLKNSPHTTETVTADKWDHPYSRSEAAYPLPYLKKNKFWVPVSRIDNAYGDRNLYCTCIPTEEYEDVEVKPLI
ncbi:MAG TPA: glycine dehydrogenase (aminomethyl-transferring), partial [Bacteroidetes bacterium]|nr:glycine dehydrogenase (aminomethyl-transferring) [Bacteroidota bacterium]